MKTHEELWEDYENAKFTLLMERVTQIEGEELIRENERLKNDPSAAVPEDLDKKCLKTIHKAFAKQRRRKATATVYRAIQKIAVPVFAIVSLFTVAYAVSPQVRLATLNFVQETSNVATGLTLADVDGKTQGDHDMNSIAGYTISYMPEGFYLANSMSDSRSERKFYENGQDASIMIQVVKTDDVVISIHNIDTEDIDSSEELSINGCDGLLIQKEARIQLTLADSENMNFIDVISDNVDIDTLLAVAEGIKAEI